MLLPAFLKNNLVSGTSVIVIIHIEAASATPSKLVRQFQNTMGRAAEFIE